MSIGKVGKLSKKEVSFNSVNKSIIKSHFEDDQPEDSVSLLHQWNHQVENVKESNPSHVEQEQKYSYWHLLPDLLLEQVFQYLTIRERYYASQVCMSWHQAFNFPRVWYTFVLHEDLFTKRKYNYYSGWQKFLDSYRASVFLTKRGEWIRSLIIPPIANLYNLYEFMNISYYMHDKYNGIMSRVETLRFHFACHQAEHSGELVFGTGGQLLMKLKQVLGMLKSLKTLELRDLLLDISEGLQLLDEVCCVCCETLQTLILVNPTKLAQTLLHAGTFINLKVLVISPQNIDGDLLELLSHTSLLHLHIVQNKYTEHGRRLTPSSWSNLRRGNPCLKVHLRSEGDHRHHIIWQPKAPVCSIVHQSPHVQMTALTLMQIVELYKHDLQVLAYQQLPRYFMPRAFNARIDSVLLLAVKLCPNIHTLMIRDKISTATVLLLARSAPNLRQFYVRRSTLMLKCDWPRCPDWSAAFHEWLNSNTHSFENTEREVSQILGYRWEALTDKQFKMISLNVEKNQFLFA